MTPATQILLFGKPFRIADYFRMGQIGWHWQFDDPNTLYRRRNLLTYTGQLTSAAYTVLRASIAASTAVSAPASGPSTLFKLTEDATAANTHFFLSAADTAVSAGRRYTSTVYARAAERSWIQLQEGQGVTAGAYFNLATGAIGTVSGTGSPTADIQSIGSGWYRCSLSWTAVSAVARIRVFLATGDGLAIYNGDGSSGAYLTGCQIELGSSATEYQDVPTTWPQAYLDAVGAERIYAWTDTAGTIPVTAVGDGTGLLLGREYGGATGPSLLANGATGLTGTATAASYSTTTFAGSVSRAGDASNQSWVTWTGLTTSAVYRLRITNTGATSLDVRNGGVAGTIVASIAAGASTWVHPATTGGSTSITITATSNSTTATFTLGQFAVLPGTHLIQATGTAKPTLSARVNLLLNTATMSTQNVTTVAAGYRLRFEGTGTVTLSGTVTAGPLSAGTHNVTATAGTLTLTVSGSVTLADLRTADDAAKNIPAYQRVGATATDHDTDGFPHYALADGTDDCWASVATVDGSAHDKISFVVAVTKNSDAASGTHLEFGPAVSSTNGSFGVRSSNTTGTTSDSYSVQLRGTSGRQWRGANGFAAPVTSVVAPILDLSSDTAYSGLSFTVNGVSPTFVGIDNAAPGGGTFSAQTLYVLARAGTITRFNGRFYGSTGRFGSMSDSERNNLTRWWQKRIGTA